MTLDVAAIRDGYSAQQPAYILLGSKVEGILKTLVTENKVKDAFVMEPRVKDVLSFVKKAIVKHAKDPVDYADPLTRISDKAGVRVVTSHLDDSDMVAALVLDRFDVLSDDDMKNRYGPRELGYLGRHLQIRLRSADIAPNERALTGLECEVQIHTRAQNAWATVSHALLYKPAGEPDDEVSAKVHRAVALVGIFDDEIRAARSLVMSDPNYRPARMLQALEAEFTDFVTVAWDGNLSLEVCRVLERVYDSAELEHFEEEIHAFVQSERGPISVILDEYGSAGGDAILVSQPEILAIYDRLKKRKHSLREAWIHSSLSLDLLIEAGRALGEPIPEPA